MIAQLRGDLYKLAGEKARLQRENDVRSCTWCKLILNLYCSCFFGCMRVGKHYQHKSQPRTQGLSFPKKDPGYEVAQITRKKFENS